MTKIYSDYLETMINKGFQLISRKTGKVIETYTWDETNLFYGSEDIDGHYFMDYPTPEDYPRTNEKYIVKAL